MRCDKSISEEIVLEILAYLETADYSIGEGIVFKVAFLAVKYATDYKWFVDASPGNTSVRTPVWYRVIHIVVIGTISRQDRLRGATSRQGFLRISN